MGYRRFLIKYADDGQCFLKRPLMSSWSNECSAFRVTVFLVSPCSSQSPPPLVPPSIPWICLPRGCRLSPILSHLCLHWPATPEFISAPSLSPTLPQPFCLRFTTNGTKTPASSASALKTTMGTCTRASWYEAEYWGALLCGDDSSDLYFQDTEQIQTSIQ